MAANWRRTGGGVAARRLVVGAVLTVIVSGAIGSSGEASGSRERQAAIPPLIVYVRAAPTIPSATVARALEEATVIWRTIGVTFDWRSEDLQPSVRISASTWPRVIIDDSRGTRRENAAPLGWITFTGKEPDGDIHISRRNAEQMLIGAVATRPMTPARRTFLLGRMMGRALAHELGHYLLRTKAHTTSGIMRSRRTAKEFIDGPQSSFAIETLDGELAAERIREVHDEALRLAICFGSCPNESVVPAARAP
jgi:hypothetical protein